MKEFRTSALIPTAALALLSCAAPQAQPDAEVKQTEPSPQQAEQQTAPAPTGPVAAEPAQGSAELEAQANEPPTRLADWGYGPDNGPDEWAGLSQEFAMCGIGKNQSPVDLAKPVRAQRPVVPNLDYGQPPTEIVHKGFSIQANYPKGNAMEVEERRFELLQVHFHTPAEHTVDGKTYPLEAHFVHADDAGNLAVLGAFFEEGTASEQLAGLVDNLPDSKGEAVSLEGVAFDASKMLPKKLDHFRYNGSLTTPPCTEGVRFFLLDKPLKASAQQLQAIRDAVGHENARPIQPLGARVIVR